LCGRTLRVWTWKSPDSSSDECRQINCLLELRLLYEGMFKAEIEEDGFSAAVICHWKCEAGNDLQLAREIVRPADAGTNSGLRIVAATVRRTRPESFDEDVESMIGEPDEA